MMDMRALHGWTFGRIESAKLRCCVHAGMTGRGVELLHNLQISSHTGNNTVANIGISSRPN